jgi:hypothetical protein
LLVAGLLVVLGGCSDGDDTSNTSSSGNATSTPSASGSSGSDASPPAEDTDPLVEITVSVQDGRVSPKPRRVEVEKDSQIRLLVTCDVDDEVHVHGFDIEEPLEAGRTTTVEFVVNEDGVFEVETHESELELLQLEVH